MVYVLLGFVPIEPFAVNIKRVFKKTENAKKKSMGQIFVQFDTTHNSSTQIITLQIESSLNVYHYLRSGHELNLFPLPYPYT